MKAPHFIKEKKHVLTDNMKNQLLNSIMWIDNKIGDELYFDPMVLTYIDTGFEEERSIIATLNKIYSLFLMTEE